MNKKLLFLGLALLSGATEISAAALRKAAQFGRQAAKPAALAFAGAGGSAAAFAIGSKALQRDRRDRREEALLEELLLNNSTRTSKRGNSGNHEPKLSPEVQYCCVKLLSCRPV